VIPVPPSLEWLQPHLVAIPLSSFAYHMAVLRGCDVDQPPRQERDGGVNTHRMVPNRLLSSRYWKRCLSLPRLRSDPGLDDASF